MKGIAGTGTLALPNAVMSVGELVIDFCIIA